MEAFLKRVLPESGDYVVMTIDPQRPKEKPRHVNGIKTVGAMANVVQRLSMHPLHIYFAVGSYELNRNKPRAKRCLFLDLDQKEFGTKQDAIKGMATFCRATGFPAPSIYVDSGRGIHAYWCFDQDLDTLGWKALATKFKAKCKEVGFEADPSCTDDVARVLRVPGTMNYKEDPPVSCRVLKDTGVSYDPKALLAALLPKQVSALAALAAVAGEGLSAMPAAVYEKVPYYGTEVATRCGVIKEALETGGANQTEPLWSNVLSVLAFCEDGLVMAHEVSKGHASYDEASCQKKFEYKLKKKEEGALKPVLCSTFAQYRSSVCAGCTYAQTINTPLVLGKKADANYLPPGYIMKPTGVYKVKKGVEDQPDTLTLVFPYCIAHVDLMQNGAGLLAKLTFTSSHNTIRTEVPWLSFVGQSSEVDKVLALSGVIVSSTHVTELKYIMAYWLKKIQDIKNATKTHTTNMGWGQRNGEYVFTAGPFIHHKDGRADTFTHVETQLLKDYEPQGDRAVWDHAASVVLKDGRPAIASTVLTAFSAPLMKFTGAPGITYSICSTASGTGKTTALKLAQAVWAHPVRAMAMLDDTPNSVAKKLGFINNLPAYWDEVRLTNDFTSFIKMIFQLGQGKEKSRLTPGIKQQEMGTWETMIIMATNERIVDHVDHIVRSSDAGRMRVFEIQLPRIAGGANASVGRDVDKLVDNYGHVGQQYAQFLATNKAKIERLVHVIQDKVVKDLKTAPEERFWVAFVASQIAAASIVNQLGIISVDPAKLQKWLYAELVNQRIGAGRNYLPPNEAAVNAVLQWAEFHRDQLVVTEFAGGKKGYGVMTHQPISKEIIGLIARKDQKLRIKESHFKAWVHSTLQHSPTVLIGELVSLGLATQKKASVTAGLANTTSARFPCIEVDLTTSAFTALIEEP